MHGSQFLGREIKVQPGREARDMGGTFSARDNQGKEPSRSLFVGNIPPEVETTDLYTHFENFGKGGDFGRHIFCPAL